MIQTISEAMSLEQYTHNEKCFVKIKALIYKANQKVSVLEAHKRTGDFLFTSSTELDRDISKWKYIEARLKSYAKSKAINLLINI